MRPGGLWRHGGRGDDRRGRGPAGLEHLALRAAGAPGRHGRRNAYLRTIARLDSLGAPLGGIGLQGHYTSPAAPGTILRFLDRYAQFGKSIGIAEFDFSTKDETLQALCTRDVLIAYFSHPAVTEFLMWGFWEGSHWRPDTAMVRRDWSGKPNHEVWRALVYGQGWTVEKGSTGEDGTFRTRGFQGEYEVTAAKDGKSVAAGTTLPAEGVAVKVVLN